VIAVFAVLAVLAAAVAAAAPTRSSLFGSVTFGGTPGIVIIEPGPTGATTGPVTQAAVAPATGTTAPATPLPVPKPPSRRLTAAEVVKLPSTRRCVTSIAIHVARPAGVHLTALSVFVGPRHVRRTPAPTSIDLHVLPKGRFTLKATVTTATGQHLTRTRHYSHCR